MLAVTVRELCLEVAPAVTYSNTVIEMSAVVLGVVAALVVELPVEVPSVISGKVSVLSVILLGAVAAVVAVAVVVVVVVAVIVVAMVALAVVVGVGGVVVVIVIVFVLTSLIPFDEAEGVSDSESPAAVREEELRRFSGAQLATIYRH